MRTFPTREHILGILKTYFNETELRDLCFHMQIDYDTLPGSGTADKAREIVLLCERRDRYPELVSICRKLCPNAFTHVECDNEDGEQEAATLPSVDVDDRPCPYMGLLAFGEQDADFFFGREVFTERLVQEVQRHATDSALRPLLAVIGSSGSGKSSIVFAGLLPRLRQQGNWVCAHFRPGSRPFAALASALMPLFDAQRSKIDPEGGKYDLAEQLRQGRLALSQVVDRVIQRQKQADRLLLIVDQFEEIYTLCTDQERRQHFLEMLLALAAPQGDRHDAPLMLVLTLRADFLGQALAYRPFADALQDGDVKLGPMTQEEMIHAIVQPAHKMNVAFEAGLVERILHDIGDEPEHLPLLEFALYELWQRRALTHAEYNAIGGVKQALALHASETYNDLNLEDQTRAEHLFVQLVQPGEGTEDTRRRATRSEIGEENWNLVGLLDSARLVVTGINDAYEETVEIIHEALIREWGQLHQWIQNHRAFRTWQERLRATLRQWHESKYDDAALLRGFLLNEAEDWLNRQEYYLHPQEREIILQSRALREREEAAAMDRVRELQIEKERLEVVHNITLALTETLDLNEIMNRTLEMVQLRYAPFSTRPACCRSRWKIPGSGYRPTSRQNSFSPSIVPITRYKTKWVVPVWALRLPDRWSSCMVVKCGCRVSRARGVRLASLFR